MKNCLQFDAIHDFSERLRIGTNPANINRFESHTGKLKTDHNEGRDNKMNLKVYVILLYKAVSFFVCSEGSR